MLAVWADTAKVTADITLGRTEVLPVQSVRDATMVSRIIRIVDATQYVKEPNNVVAVGACVAVIDGAIVVHLCNTLQIFLQKKL